LAVTPHSLKLVSNLDPAEDLLTYMISQRAAELLAAGYIYTAELAPLTMFHHVRALYEMHAVAYWMFQDFDSRWMRLLKDHLVERNRFEEACKS